MKHLKKFSQLNEIGVPGMVGAMVGASRKPQKSKDQEASKEDDIFLLSVLVNPILGRYTNFNAKLVEVEIDKREKKTGLRKLFAGSSRIEFSFDANLENDKLVRMQYVVKEDRLKPVESNTDGDKTIMGSFADKESRNKFIKHLAKSNWHSEISKNFPDFDKLLNSDK